MSDKGASIIREVRRYIGDYLMAGKGYRPGLTVKKFFMQFFLVGIIAALLWAVEIGLPELSLSYPEYSVILSLVAALVIAFANYLKHYQDSE